MSTKERVPRGSMKIPQSTPTILSLAVAATFCFSAATWAQSPGQSQNPRNPATVAPVAQSSSQENTTVAPQDQQKPRTSGNTVDPSQAPLQPVTTYPDAAGNPQLQAPTQPQSTTAGQSQVPRQQTEPQGSATAGKVPTAGGAAAKPAGAAIAPAKQRQARSLLIKMGAVVAGAVAAGTIYALSKGTPSTPPGSTSPSAVQKR
jgi:cytoskeletal protein RodZ